jgi:hypothetical protein
MPIWKEHNMPRRIKRFGWKPDFPDHRDQFFSPSREVLQALPRTRSNRPIRLRANSGLCARAGAEAPGSKCGPADA